MQLLTETRGSVAWLSLNRPEAMNSLSRELLLRQENQPKPIRDIAWKGQVRLCARYRRLARTGKPANVVTTAIARELSGFVWAIARHVTIPAG